MVCSSLMVWSLEMDFRIMVCIWRVMGKDYTGHFCMKALYLDTLTFVIYKYMQE